METFEEDRSVVPSKNEPKEDVPKMPENIRKCIMDISAAFSVGDLSVFVSGLHRLEEISTDLAEDFTKGIWFVHQELSLLKMLYDSLANNIVQLPMMPQDTMQLYQKQKRLLDLIPTHHEELFLTANAYAMPNRQAVAVNTEISIMNLIFAVQGITAMNEMMRDTTRWIVEYFGRRGHSSCFESWMDFVPMNGNDSAGLFLDVLEIFYSKHAAGAKNTVFGYKKSLENIALMSKAIASRNMRLVQFLLKYGVPINAWMEGNHQSHHPFYLMVKDGELETDPELIVFLKFLVNCGFLETYINSKGDCYVVMEDSVGAIQSRFYQLVGLYDRVRRQVENITDLASLEEQMPAIRHVQKGHLIHAAVQYEDVNWKNPEGSSENDGDQQDCLVPVVTKLWQYSVMETCDIGVSAAMSAVMPNDAININFSASINPNMIPSILAIYLFGGENTDVAPLKIEIRLRDFLHAIGWMKDTEETQSIELGCRDDTIRNTTRDLLMHKMSLLARKNSGSVHNEEPLSTAALSDIMNYTRITPLGFKNMDFTDAEEFPWLWEYYLSFRTMMTYICQVTDGDGAEQTPSPEEEQSAATVPVESIQKQVKDVNYVRFPIIIGSLNLKRNALVMAELKVHKELEKKRKVDAVVRDRPDCFE
ncbi:MAG: hypothetical protein JSS82_03570 [Bacteroidetes bacterium]|nr:hypothetical protein [Bacteroidota bacterium]